MRRTTLGDGNRLAFPTRSGGPSATSTLLNIFQYHEVAAVVHGLSLRRSIAMADSSTDRMRWRTALAVAALTCRMTRDEPVGAESVDQGRDVLITVS